MKVLRLVPVGLFVVAGAGLAGCGEGDLDPVTGTSSDMRMMVNTDKVDEFVEREDYVSEKATDKDPHLLNAWGLVFGPDGLGWIASNGKGTLVAYDSEGVLKHEIQSPTPKRAEEVPAPTGVVWNSMAMHKVFKGDELIFVTEGGTVAGADRTDTEAKLRVVTKGAVYKGVAIASSHGKPQLYVTDFVGGKIDVFDDHYRRVWTHGGFVDRDLKKNFEPFNIQATDDKLLVTYALREEGGEDDVAGPGNGFVDVFDAEGHLIQRLISQGALNSPWGLAFEPEETDMATSKHKKHAHKQELLVGNFGDGRINVYELSTRHGGRIHAEFEGALGDPDTGKPRVIDGLWALVFGNDLGGFEVEDLYFTAGPNEEADGVFGELAFEEEDAATP